MKKRNLWKRAVSVGMAAVLTLSLAGCGQGGAQTAGSVESAGTTQNAESGEASQSAAGWAEADNGEVVTLKGFTMGNEPAAGMDTFYEQLDAMTVTDLGIKVRFDFIPWGDEKNKINLNIASGEYDLYCLLYTSPSPRD